MSDRVLFDLTDGVATVTLNRPDKLNAMDVALLKELLTTLQSAADNPEVGVVILTGAGRGFSAGGDRDETGEPWGAGLSEDVALLRNLMASSELVHDMPKVTIAAVNGPCAGGALSLACAVDLRYAASSAVFTTAFAKAGLPGDFGGTWTLPRIVGEGKARELYLLSDRIDAAEAERFGLVSKVLPDDELMPFVRSTADTLVSMGRATLAEMKQNLNDAADATFSEQLDREAERQVTAARRRDGGRPAAGDSLGE